MSAACGMSGLVILDGPDAVGKTTLANALLNGDRDGYVHLTYDSSWSNPNRELWKLQYVSLLKAQIRLEQGKLTVIDRHWMSEQVYARTYRGGSGMNAESRQWDRVVQRLCGVYVICAPSAESARERHHAQSKSRYEMYPPDDRIFDVARRFRDLWLGSNTTDDDYASSLMRKGGMRLRQDAALYDIDEHGHDLDGVCWGILRKLDSIHNTQYPSAFTRKKGNYLGHPHNAKFLFVGERINPSKAGRWPFVDYGASSATLCEALSRCDFDETQGMWTNAYAEDEHVPTLMEWFPYLRVIALGEVAALYLEGIGIPYSKVVHPSYARRFGRTGLIYEQLEEALR